MDFWTGLLLSILQTALSPTTAAFVLAAIGLNIHFGYTGLMNMGQAGFMLVGAYGFGVSVSFFGLGFWPAILVAMVCAVIFALILGIPTLKLRGDYLAIVTISAAEIIRMVGRSTVLDAYTGGSSGLTGNSFKGTFQALSPLPDGTTTIGPWTYANNGSDSWWLRIVAWSLVLLAILVVWLLTRSPWGRVLKGIREDEDAVRALGKNVYGYKMQALVLGGIFGALGGVLFVLPRAVQPDGLGRTATFWVWTVLLLGGAATVFGPLIGSMLFFAAYMLVRSGMRAALPETLFSTTQIEQLGGMLVGVVLMCLVIFRPQGIFGNKKELAFDGH